MPYTPSQAVLDAAARCEQEHGMMLERLDDSAKALRDYLLSAVVDPLEDGYLDRMIEATGDPDLKGALKGFRARLGVYRRQQAQLSRALEADFRALPASTR